MTFGSRARIRLGAIQHNLRSIKSGAPGVRVIAVVKANAYGHGLVPVGSALANADALAVARLSEARVLRDAGIDTPVVLLGGVLSAADVGDALALDVQLGIHHPQQLDWLEAHSSRAPFAWLKIDTGMHRLGVHPDEAGNAIARLRACADTIGIMTHLASADEKDNSMTLQQIERFVSLTDGFDGHVSIANSAAVLGWSEPLGQLQGFVRSGRLWIRPGLSIYGISPFPGKTGPDLGLQPAMQFEARLISVKPICAGSCVGYGGAWTATSDTILGVVAVGYGDGYSRYIPSGAPVIVNGRRVTVAGRISMDLMAVDLGPDARDEVGDPVILWGDGLPVEEIAGCAGTIPYQLVTGVSHREAPLYETS